MILKLLTAVRRLAALQLAIAQLALVAMMLAIVTDVTMRGLFNHPVRGTYDAVGILLCVSALFAVAHVILNRQEIVIDLIDNFVSPQVTGGLQKLWNLIAVVMIGFVLFSMVKPMLEARQYGDRSLELGLPMWWVWVLALIGMGGAMLAALAAAFTAPLSHDAGRAQLEEGIE
jgi:TRAP-type transport system small permease protein